MDAAHLDELARAAREGNRLALEQFTRLTLPDVQALCWHLGDPDTAEDLVQETYARMMRSLPTWRAEGPARSWLLRIARNTCADATRRRVRQRARRSRAELPDVAGPPPQGWAEVEALVADLDPDRRSAFVLTQVLGLPYAEAAQVLDVPIGTVRSRVARARDELVRRHADSLA